MTNHHNIDSLLKKAQEESLNIKFKTLTTEDKFIRIKNGGESAIDGKVHYYNAKNRIKKFTLEFTPKWAWNFKWLSKVHNTV